MSGCTGVGNTGENKVKIMLHPIHPKAFTLSHGREFTKAIVDNDGNQYVTRWRAPSVGTETKEESYQKCLSSMSGSDYIFGRKFFGEFQESDIKQKFYQVIANCMILKGYSIVESDAYFPVSYNIVIKKTYSSYGETVGAGANIVFENRDKNLYKDLYKDVVFCYEKNNVEESVDEGGFSGFIYISVESYVKSYQRCIDGLGYETSIR